VFEGVDLEILFGTQQVGLVLRLGADHAVEAVEPGDPPEDVERLELGEVPLGQVDCPVEHILLVQIEYRICLLGPPLLQSRV